MYIQSTFKLIKQIIALFTSIYLLISGIFFPSVEKNISLLDNHGSAVYCIVWSESDTGMVKGAAQDLGEKLNLLSGANFNVKADLKNENDFSENAYEILVGNTNRRKSLELIEGLEESQYIIAVRGAKIVILGGSDYATAKATEAFASLFEHDKKFELQSYFTLISRVEVQSKDGLIAVTNQAASTIEVFDANTGVLDNSSLIWSLKLPHSSVAGVKLRQHDKYGEVALAVCGNNYAAMLAYPAGKTIWSTENAANNPHSIELLPGDIIAVASSTGNAIRFFDLDGSSKRYVNLDFEDAHGVLWDPQNEVLWALGRDMLRAFSVSKNAVGEIEVAEVIEHRSTVPTDYGHNLSPVYGNKDQLWISSGSQVYIYDKTTKTFSNDFEGSDKIIHKSVKGIGNFYDGSLLLTAPDGVFKSWTTATVSYYPKLGNDFNSKNLTSASGAFYKARVWYSEYQ